MPIDIKIPRSIIQLVWHFDCIIFKKICKYLVANLKLYTENSTKNDTMLLTCRLIYDIID